MKVFTQTEFDNSSGIENSPNHILLAPDGYFKGPENFTHKPATYFSSQKIDADDDFSAKKTRYKSNMQPLIIFLLTLQPLHKHILLQRSLISFMNQL